MTAQTRPTNTSRFEQGDQPQGSDFADLIDSFVSLVDVTAQVVASDLKAANFVTSGEVSAAVISAPTFNLTNISVTRAAATDLHVSTSARMAGTLNVVGAATFPATVSASSAWFGGAVQFNTTMNFVNFVSAWAEVCASFNVMPVPASAARFIQVSANDGNVYLIPLYRRTRV